MRVRTHIELFCGPCAETASWSHLFLYQANAIISRRFLITCDSGCLKDVGVKTELKKEHAQITTVSTLTGEQGSSVHSEHAARVQ